MAQKNIKTILNNPATSEEVTPEMVAEWKAKYGDVFVIESEGRKAWIRRPDRKVISAAAVNAGADLLKNRELILRNCWLGGDMALQNNDRYFLAFASQIEAIIEIAEVAIKKA